MKHSILWEKLARGNSNLHQFILMKCCVQVQVEEFEIKFVSVISKGRKWLSACLLGWGKKDKATHFTVDLFSATNISFLVPLPSPALYSSQS